jgi:hypothetical protein
LSYAFFYKKLDQTARRLFPGLQEMPDGAVPWDHLISPLEIRLPKAVYEKAEAAIRAFYAVSRRPQFQAALDPVPGVSDVEKKHASVLMAYDFHTSESGEISLVEINTNAAGYLMSSLMEMVHTDRSTLDTEPLQKLRASFEEELKLWGKAGSVPTVGITDENVRQQKMFVEFLMYRDWFRSFGWTAGFCDSDKFHHDGHRLSMACADCDSMAGEPLDLVYNRGTDFYLEDPVNSALRAGYTADSACITPNPREYWLLADKQRLIQFTDPDFLNKVGASGEEQDAIRQVLIPTFEKTAFGSPDEVWAQRKNLFFKPKRSYGGKSVYRGESVSRKVFERLMSEDVLIQHFTPAQRVPHDDPRSVLNNWKFDLRFYVYMDRIQMVAARIYQGQVTNFSSPLGGFTQVHF